MFSQEYRVYKALFEQGSRSVRQAFATGTSIDDPVEQLSITQEIAYVSGCMHGYMQYRKSNPRDARRQLSSDV